MVDNVNHPPHYKSEGGLEVIDVISSFCDIKEVCKGNAIKYILRAGKKDNTVQDLEKAIWYIKRWIEEENGE